jgi:hypothetical protein
MEHLSLQELYKGNLEGGLLHWGALKDIKRKSLDMGISLHRGPNGEPGGEVHLLGTSRDRKEGSGNTASLSLYGALQGNPGGRAPLLGGPEGYINKSLDMGISLYRGPNGEPGGEVHLPGTLRDRKEGSGNTASLSIRLCKGNLEEGLFYWGP